MDGTTPAYDISEEAGGRCRLNLHGDWTIQQDVPEFSELAAKLQQLGPQSLHCDVDGLGDWDSALPAFLLHCHQFCEHASISFETDALPEYAVRIADIQFAAQGNEALLVAEWAITMPRAGESGSRGISRLTTPIDGAEPEHVARAYSALLLDLSEIIADAPRQDQQMAAAGS